MSLNASHRNVFTCLNLILDELYKLKKRNTLVMVKLLSFKKLSRLLYVSRMHLQFVFFKKCIQNWHHFFIVALWLMRIGLHFCDLVPPTRNLPQRKIWWWSYGRTMSSWPVLLPRREFPHNLDVPHLIQGQFWKNKKHKNLFHLL